MSEGLRISARASMSWRCSTPIIPPPPRARKEEKDLLLDYGHNWTQDETCEFIERCYDRDTLLATLLNYGEAWLVGRMICIVAHEHIQPFLTRGWSGWGTEEETSEAMSRGKILLESSPLLEAIVDQGSYTVGTPEELGFEAIFEAANVLEPEDLIIIPLQLAQRTKMLLIGEPKQTTQDLLEFSRNLEPLVHVADQVARQLEVIIKLAKSDSLPPRELRIPEPPQRVSSSILDMEDVQDVLASARAHLTDERDVAEEEEAMVSTPPQLRAPHEQGEDAGPYISPRHTQPIQLDRLTHRRPSDTLSDMFDESVNAGREQIDEREQGSSTHLGTPLNMINDGMSIDIVKHHSTPVLSANALAQLPENPFEGDESSLQDAQARLDASPSPSLHRRPQETQELEGVSIIQPIGVSDQKRSQKTLMGGFSIEDFKRAQERFEEETPSSPRIQRNPKTIPGLSTPIPRAQILRRRKRQSTEEVETSPRTLDESSSPSQQEPEETPSQEADNPTLKVPAISREQMQEDRARRAERMKTPMLQEPMIMPWKEPMSSPTRTHEVAISQPYERPRYDSAGVPSEIPEHLRPSEPTQGEELYIAAFKMVDPMLQEKHANADDDQDIYSTRKLEPIIAPEDTEDEGEQETSSRVDQHRGQPASTAKKASFPMEVSQSTRNWSIYFAKLESRDKKEAYSVVDAFTADPLVLVRLEELFPGRLYIDRYQWTFETLPPIEEHGPVIAVLHRLGEEGSLVSRHMMESSSLELRFYATFLLSEHPVPDAIPLLLERIFDRDIQTRKLAARGLKRLATRHPELVDQKISSRLAEIVTRHEDDFHVELAAELLGELRAQSALPALISELDRNSDRLKQVIYQALMKISLQPLPSATIAWRTWHRQAQSETREDWVLQAMLSSSEQVRRLVAQEIAQMPGADIAFSPDAPQNARVRAQQELKHFFEAQGR